MSHHHHCSQHALTNHFVFCFQPRQLVEEFAANRGIFDSMADDAHRAAAKQQLAWVVERNQAFSAKATETVLPRITVFV